MCKRLTGLSSLVSQDVISKLNSFGSHTLKTFDDSRFPLSLQKLGKTDELIAITGQSSSSFTMTTSSSSSSSSFLETKSQTELKEVLDVDNTESPTKVFSSGACQSVRA